MSGMLTKEFLYIKVQKRVLYSILIIAVILPAAMLGQSHSAPTAVELAGLLGVLMGMLSAVEIFNGVASDEKAKWDSFARSLPVSAVQTVGAKYLLLLILSAVGIVLGTVIEFAVTGGHADANTMLILCGIAFGIPILMCSIELPLFYKFGMQKSNIVVLVVFCFCPILLGKLADQSNIMKWTDAQFFTALKILPLILLAILAVSFFLSCRIYSNKEV